MKKILITNQYIRKFSGSEMACYDLVQEFLHLGYTVYIGTFEFSMPLKEYFTKLNVNIVLLHKGFEGQFDIIWAHHFTTLDYCLTQCRLDYRYIVYSSLSPYDPLETPPIYHKSIHLITSNSSETSDELLRLGVDRNKLYLLPNPVRTIFFDYTLIKNETIKKIAVVSNHMPSELLSLGTLFKLKNIQVDYFGRLHKQTLVTPELLSGYDVVISIGRTVQYCLAMGIPVYCYDRFGGPGYILESNLESASKHNFSGRCCHAKHMPQHIVDQIIDNYGIAVSQQDQLQAFARTHYDLSGYIDEILQILPEQSVNISGLEKQLNIISRQREYYLNEKLIRLHRVLSFYEQKKSFIRSKYLIFKRMKLDLLMVFKQKIMHLFRK